MKLYIGTIAGAMRSKTTAIVSHLFASICFIIISKLQKGTLSPRVRAQKKTRVRLFPDSGSCFRFLCGEWLESTPAARSKGQRSHNRHHGDASLCAFLNGHAGYLQNTILQNLLGR